MPQAPAAVGRTRDLQRPETIRLYMAEWLAFVAWCRVARRSALPADAETLSSYLLAVAAGSARGTLGRKRSAIRAMHRQQHLPLPELDPLARAAIRRVAAPVIRRADPALATNRAPGAWVQLAVRCPGDLAGLRDRALLLLAACQRATGEELLGLQVEQVRLVEAGAELRLARATPGSVLVPRDTAAACPVRALEDWLRASDTKFGPVFRKIDRWGNVEHARLGADGLCRIVARRKADRGHRSKAR